MSADNGVVNGGYYYINSSTGYVINNNNFIEYTKKRDEIYTNRYLRWNNELPDGVEIDDMLPASAPDKYVHM